MKAMRYIRMFEMSRQDTFHQLFTKSLLGQDNILGGFGDKKTSEFSSNWYKSA